MNLTLGQKIAMALIFINALSGGSAQLTPVFGTGVTTIIVSIASLAGTIVSGWIFIVTGQQQIVKQVDQTTLIGAVTQDNLVKSVLRMPGVENIDVNKKASPELAAIAVDPEQPKISAVPKDLQAVAETAKTAAGT